MPKLSSIVVVNTSGKEFDILKSNQAEIKNLILEIEKTRTVQDMVILSTSKSLEPPSTKEKYTLIMKDRSGFVFEQEISLLDGGSWSIQKESLLQVIEPNTYMDYTGAGELKHEDSPMPFP